MTRALTANHVQALQYAGIDAPARGWRTTCPRCSAGRVKASERCLRIYETDGRLFVNCKHCPMRKEIEV